LYDQAVKSTDIIRALAEGWYLVRVEGSHYHFAHPTKSGLVTVPHPRKDVSIGTIESIERQSGMTLR